MSDNSDNTFESMNNVDTSIIGQLVGCLWYDPLTPVYLTSKTMTGKNDEFKFQQASFQDKQGHVVSTPVLYNAFSSEKSLQCALLKSWTRKEWLMTHPGEEIPKKLLDPSSQLDHPDQLYPVPKEYFNINRPILQRFNYPYLMGKDKMHLGKLPAPGGFPLFGFQDKS